MSFVERLLAGGFSWVKIFIYFVLALYGELSAPAKIVGFFVLLGVAVLYYESGCEETPCSQTTTVQYHLAHNSNWMKSA